MLNRHISFFEASRVVTCKTIVRFLQDGELLVCDGRITTSNDFNFSKAVLPDLIKLCAPDRVIFYRDKSSTFLNPDQVAIIVPPFYAKAAFNIILEKLKLQKLDVLAREIVRTARDSAPEVNRQEEVQQPPAPMPDNEFPNDRDREQASTYLSLKTPEIVFEHEEYFLTGLLPGDEEEEELRHDSKRFRG